MAVSFSAIRNVTEQRRIEAMRYSFVADASHELKTPVAAIQAAMETVQKAIDRDPETAKRLAAGAEQSAVRLGRIVGDLLDLSRLETEQISPEEVELSGLVAEVLDRAAPLAAERGVTLESSLHPVKVSGQQSDLVLAVRNLVENAIGYTDRGGKVTVRLDEVDGGAVLVVEDTGIGIPTRELPRIFERFYRVDASALPQHRWHRSRAFHRPPRRPTPRWPHRSRERTRQRQRLPALHIQRRSRWIRRQTADGQGTESDAEHRYLRGRTPEQRRPII